MSKENMGKVVNKLFGRTKVKSLMKEGDSSYYYEHLLFIHDSFRENEMMRRIKVPSYMSIEMEHEMCSIYIPTTFVLNTAVQEYMVLHHGTTTEFWFHLGGVQLDSKALGFGNFSTMDQMFINSLASICQALVICEGKPIDLPDGRNPSKNLHQSFIGRISADNTQQAVTTTWYSNNCLKALPLTCELNNSTCQQCVHDINQRIRQLHQGGFISKERADILLRRGKGFVAAKKLDTEVKVTSEDIEAEEPSAKKVKLAATETTQDVPSDNGQSDEEGEISGSDEEVDETKGHGLDKGGAARNTKVSNLNYI